MRVVVVGGGDDDSSCERGWVGGLEDTGSNEDSITTELHHQLQHRTRVSTSYSEMGSEGED